MSFHGLKILGVAMFCLTLSGCSYLACEIAEVSCSGYYEEKLDEVEPKWNSWIGKTKDEYIKREGPPDRCTTLDSGEEVCQWRKGGISGGGNYSGGRGQSQVSSWQHSLNWTYDCHHIARHWAYNGNLGRRDSKAITASNNC